MEVQHTVLSNIHSTAWNHVEPTGLWAIWALMILRELAASFAQKVSLGRILYCKWQHVADQAGQSSWCFRVIQGANSTCVSIVLTIQWDNGWLGINIKNVGCAATCTHTEGGHNMVAKRRYKLSMQSFKLWHIWVKLLLSCFYN